MLGLYLVLGTLLHAQKEANVWYFGDSIIMSFNDSSATLSFDARLEEWEASSVICNSEGELLLYSNGRKVLDSAHQEITGWPSPLISGYHVSQGVLMLPYKEDMVHLLVLNSPKLYLATVDLNTKSLGTFEEIYDDRTQHMTAVKHANGQDWWIVTHQRESDQFGFCLLKSDGSWELSSQNIGTNFMGKNSIYIAGTFTFSPNGEKMAASYALGVLDHFHFDRCTGRLSDYVGVDSNGYAYVGLAYSPSNEYLYMTEGAFSQENRVLQYFTDTSDIKATERVLFSAPSIGGGEWMTFLHIKLAPDSNMYFVTADRADSINRYLSVIYEPDSVGLACNLSAFEIDLFPKKSNVGLPNYPNYSLGVIFIPTSRSRTGSADLPGRFGSDRQS